MRPPTYKPVLRICENCEHSARVAGWNGLLCFYGETPPAMVPQSGPNQNADFGPPDPEWIALRSVDKWSDCDFHVRDTLK